MEKRRRIIAFILLAVFLPAFMLSILHKHTDSALIKEECPQCVHHIPHAGHINAYDGGISECIICHFLCIPFVVVLAAVILPPASLQITVYSFVRKSYLTDGLRHNLSRAPPVFPFA